ncbi:MAG: hypothetical protein JW785_03010 [Acidimicrobiia bacterium]|nr:hypothetical protein [Acidimicrobiia bacterium]
MTKHKDSEGSSPEAEAHRSHLRDALERNARDQDRAVMTISGGALALSLTFLGDFSGSHQGLWLLRLSWLFLGVSLALTVLSMQASTSNIRARIRQVDQGEPEKTRWRFATRLATTLAAWVLVGGLASLVSFAILNV